MAEQNSDRQYDLVVLGAGPGGYVGAIRAAQLGLQVAIVDEHDLLGGTCLRVGCIPSKALLESTARLADARESLEQHGIHVSEIDFDLAAMMKRKDRVVRTLTKGVSSLLKKNDVASYQGRGRIRDAGRVVVEGESGETELQAKHILVATGSRAATLEGVELDDDRIGTSAAALAFESVPERLVVIGAGYIGLELGSVWSRLGSEVTVLEALDRVLPETDAELAAKARELLEKQGLEFRLETRVQRAAVEDGTCVVECEGDDEPLEADRVLLAVGRVPNTDGLGLEDLGVELDDRGFVAVDEDYRTSAEGVYAIGDCIGGAMLAHKASDEAIACVEKIATGYGHVNYDAIPAVVYTHPEIASVGRTEEQLEEAGRDYRKGTFPFQASGRARTLGDTAGFVKVLADAETDRLLGVHILGPHAGELIAEAAVAMHFGASSEDLARCCHAHPTLAEAVREAALAVRDRAIHA